MNTEREIAPQHNLMMNSIHWLYELENQSMKRNAQEFSEWFFTDLLATSVQPSAPKTPESTNAQSVVEICHTQSSFCPSFPVATYILLCSKSSHPPNSKLSLPIIFLPRLLCCLEM